ncbi:hypothetical protein [Azospirillum lipoferum]|uniref:Uncharacterized protein n=1 Tax=Azospirillum lipoferum (strain 4B) TaxID=862719 RepID=G7ZFH3_AZOL4|nr:hypothetical protein [Azospirillum lipoferum]CBS90281.1 protein of unknown function [Azospirillum lipoferum 4B]
MSTDALNQEIFSARTTQVVRYLPHERVAAYLKAHGWQDAGPYGPHARIYSLGKGATKKELVLPTTNDVADYQWRMQDIVQTLARLERRAVAAVCTDLLLRSGSIDVHPHQKELIEKQKEIARELQSIIKEMSGNDEPCHFDDLVRFISLASQAAEEAVKEALEAGSDELTIKLMKALIGRDAGHC